MENFDSRLRLVPSSPAPLFVRPPTSPPPTPPTAPPSVPASPSPLQDHLAVTAAQNAHATGRKHAGWRFCHALARLTLTARGREGRGLRYVALHCCNEEGIILPRSTFSCAKYNALGRLSNGSP